MHLFADLSRHVTCTLIVALCVYSCQQNGAWKMFPCTLLGSYFEFVLIHAKNLYWQSKYFSFSLGVQNYTIWNNGSIYGITFCTRDLTCSYIWWYRICFAFVTEAAPEETNGITNKGCNNDACKLISLLKFIEFCNMNHSRCGTSICWI